jgi:F-type H+-transporting ATPase subunit b
MDFHSLFISIAQAATDATPHATEIIQEAVQHATSTAEHAESAGVLGTLGIDWKLFIGQLVNFGIILLVLWKWVFTPVAKKLTERTDKIEKSLHDADRITKEKQEFEVWKNAEMNKARQEALSIVTTAQAEAGKAKQAIIDQTKAEQQKLVDQAKTQIESEKNKALQEAKGELADLVTNATEKILRKKLDHKADQEFIKESLSLIK